MCRGSDLAGAKVVAERLRRAVADRKFSFGGTDIPVTISLGIATMIPTSECVPERLLGAADGALYTAKREGRNCIREVMFETGKRNPAA